MRRLFQVVPPELMMAATEWALSERAVNGQLPPLPSNEQLLAAKLAADWAFAVRAFRVGEPEYLEWLLRGDAKIPPEVRALLADVIAGTLKISRRGKGKKSALGLRDREQIAVSLARFRGLLRAELDAAEVAADHNAAHGQALIDAGMVRRANDERIARFITSLAERYGVTEAVVKKARLPE